jgi:DNA-binding NarL/FixJ family response regulator
MNRTLNLLLVEDDQYICEKIKQYIDELNDTSLIGITNSSEKALEYVINYLPDAVILDLELHHGSGNGLLFLQELNKASLPFHPYILVSTNNSSNVTYEYARRLGVDFIMSKHQADFSPQGVIEFLRMMKDVIYTKSDKLQDKNQKTNESPQQKEKRIRRMISAEFDRIGLSPKLVGRCYLTDAVCNAIQKAESNLCVTLGKKYGKTDSSVERAMQNAISKAWRTSDIDDLSQYYTAKISSEKGVPTLTEFIYFYVNKIKNEL